MDVAAAHPIIIAAQLTDWLTAVGSLLGFAAMAVLAGLGLQPDDHARGPGAGARDQVEIMRKSSADEAAAVREQIEASVALAAATKETADAARQELDLLRDQADAARRQGDVAEAALNASVRPLLIDVARHTLRDTPLNVAITSDGQSTGAATRPVDFSIIRWDIRENDAWPRVPVRNVRARVARVIAAAVTVSREGAIGEPVVSGVVPSVIGAGEHAYVMFRATADTEERRFADLSRLLQSEEEIVVEVACSDLAGRQEGCDVAVPHQYQ
jgi:hypothetical protein